MKKKTLHLSKKLSLQKEKITDMAQVLGGEPESITIVTTTVVVGPPIVVLSALACTRGKNCDLPSYSHDDGSYCVSASRIGCNCPGRG